MSDRLVYAGKDLESMSFAVNYHKWILDEFRPFLGKRLVEVGAGTGAFSELLLEENPISLTLVEPSEMFSQLRANVEAIAKETDVEYHNAFFGQVHQQIASTRKPDSVIYVNVLEHIEDDVSELSIIYSSLSHGGRCFIFVPALMSLYGEFDRKIGHFRRYKKSEILEKCRSAGFKILKSGYFDFAGVFPWYVKYKILRSDSLGAGAVGLYDRLAVPVLRATEPYIPLPFGKNVLIVAEK